MKPMTDTTKDVIGLIAIAIMIYAGLFLGSGWAI